MKKWIIIIVAIIIVVILGARFDSGSSENTLVDDVVSDSDITLDEASCLAASGTWNSCGSACRTDPGAACIQVCVEYCECASNEQCPNGLVCGDYVDEIGVCL